MFKPFKHQADELARSGELTYRAIFWEQGTGKTKLMLDNIDLLATQGNIDAVLIIAPNGVHRNWIEDEIPKHLPKVAPWSHFWTSSKASTIRHQREFDTALRSKFSIVAMTYEAFMTKRGKAWSKKFLTQRECFMILDESTAIKNPGAKRTRTFLAAGKHARYRRILTGTPVTNGPFDVYAPMKFLDSVFWKVHGFPTFTEFNHYFGIWQTSYNSEQQREFEHVVSYRFLDELKTYLDPHSCRVTKDEVLDLPPKLYSKRYFELTPEQKRVYQSIKEEAMAFLSSGEICTAALAIVRLLRFQQILSNYLPEDDGNPHLDLGPKNPRLDCLAELMEEVPDQAIIWARFSRDIDLIMDLLGKRAVRYDGQVNSDNRAANKAAFIAGDKQYFVGTAAAGGMGLTLIEAHTAVYYNNTFVLKDRLQSEDRNHRSGTTAQVNYVDIMARGTVDEHIVKSLLSKDDVAIKITGDKLREWIR